MNAKFQNGVLKSKPLILKRVQDGYIFLKARMTFLHAEPGPELDSGSNDFSISFELWI
jgi:hypothetical protein